MKPYCKRIISAISIFAVMLCGCRNNSTRDWEDTLPSRATEGFSATIAYDTTEATTTTPEITIITTEKTKRTAQTESTPELATTTTTPPTEETSPTMPTDIPNVPISEYTSSTAVENPEESAGSTAGTTASSSSAGSSASVIEADVTETTELDSLKYNSADEIQRPYSYNQLSEKQMYIYDAIISAAERLRTDINFSSVMDITAEDYCAVYQQVYNEEHALFYIDTKMQYAVNTSTNRIASSIMNYKYSDETIRRMQTEIEAEASRVLNMITPEMTEYDIVKLFHDYLASNVVYDETEENCRDIYGVFVKKRAICGGYSKAFSYLCDKVGIETVTVTGDADGEAHMWNMVKIDGEWYNIDVTYAVADNGSYVRYDYFCVTDEMLADSRTVYEQIYTYPKATSDACDYYVKNGMMADSWDEARAMLMNQITEASKDKQKIVQIKCSSRTTYDVVVFKLFDKTQKQAIKIFEEALPTAENEYDCKAVNYSQDSTSMVVKLFIEYTE